MRTKPSKHRSIPPLPTPKACEVRKNRVSSGRLLAQWARKSANWMQDGGHFVWPCAQSLTIGRLVKSAERILQTALGRLTTFFVCDSISIYRAFLIGKCARRVADLCAALHKLIANGGETAPAILDAWSAKRGAVLSRPLGCGDCFKRHVSPPSHHFDDPDTMKTPAAQSERSVCAAGALSIH